MGPDLPPEADDLYALEPSEFTKARNDVVRRLRAEGRRDEAASVSRLRRPTPAAWALNSVARERPELVQRALEEGRRLKEATEAAVGGDSDQLRQAIADDQAASADVVELASQALGDRGPSLSPRIRATLRAAVLAEEVAEALSRGVLAGDHESSGFDFGAGFAAVPPKERSSTKSRGSTRSRTAAPSRTGEGASANDRSGQKAERAKEELAKRERRSELRTRMREIREQIADLERDARRHDSEARQARAKAEKLTSEIEKVKSQLDDW